MNYRYVVFLKLERFLEILSLVVIYIRIRFDIYILNLKNEVVFKVNLVGIMSY